MPWAITGTQDEASFFDDHIRAILTQERMPLPPREQRVGHVEVRWDAVGPREAFVQARGGTSDDRLYAQLWLVEQLRPHGYRQATYSFDDEFFRRYATWDDVQAKAKRLCQSGAVKMLRNGYQNIVAQVTGDHGTYEVEIFRQDPNSRAITGSDCGCDWGEFQNQPRTRTWKRFQDRPCSHILAAYWTSLATPIDEENDPRGPGGPSDNPFYQMPGGWSQQGWKQPQPSLMDVPPTNPGGGLAPGRFTLPRAAPSGQLSPDQMQLPGMGAGGPQDAAQGPVGPSPRDVLPQFPMEGVEQGQINPASIPGARGPSPTNPLNMPAGPGGALSSWRFAWSFPHLGDEAFTGDVYQPAPSFQNTDMVQLRYDDRGTLVGRSEAHGAGQETPIKAGQIGEVLGTDPRTGMVNVLYMGKPWDQNSYLQPYGATAWHWPSYLIPRPDVKKPGPAIRRSQ